MLDAKHCHSSTENSLQILSRCHQYSENMYRKWPSLVLENVRFLRKLHLRFQSLLFESMMSCTKAEVHNVLQCRHKKIKPRQQATYTENCMSFEHVVLRYASGQTDRLIAILRTTSWGAVTLHAMTNKWTTFDSFWQTISRQRSAAMSDQSKRFCDRRRSFSVVPWRHVRATTCATTHKCHVLHFTKM